VDSDFDFDFDWTGLDWTGLDWTGLDWTGLDWTGLDWTGLDWTGVWMVNAPAPRAPADPRIWARDSRSSWVAATEAELWVGAPPCVAFSLARAGAVRSPVQQSRSGSIF